MKNVSQFVFFGLLLGQWAHAATELGKLKPEQIYLADSKKTQFFIKEGMIVGGDHSINDVVVLDIRHAKKSGFERIVIDLEGNKNGEPAVIKRPPYYQFEVSPELKRVVFTVFGNPKLNFNSDRVSGAFRKSGVIRKVDLFPILDKDRWTFAVDMKKDASIEVFELSDPVRIIVDMKPQGAVRKTALSKKKH